ncbi:MAG: DUF6596 domain-containing protein [Acidobacteriota bacterium]
MTTDASDVRRVLERIVRRERGRLVAGLAARLGPAGFALAEDVAQDALVEAMAAWPYQGLPDEPAAWLQRVARNKAIDRLRRDGRLTAEEDLAPVPIAARRPLERGELSDPELRLADLCCHPTLSRLEQLTLTLKMVGGFTAREVATVFLADPAAIGQRVARAQRKLRAAVDAEGDLGGSATVFELRRRLPAIRRTIYLLFSLGYAPRDGDRLVRDDVCREACRLAELLCEHPASRDADSHALAALLALQSARRAARTDAEGKPVLLRDQDRSLWDREAIARGVEHLSRARDAVRPSAWHLEAAIAAAHAGAPTWEATPWSEIDRLYRLLERFSPSPVAAVNGCVARIMVGRPQEALDRLDTLSAEGRLRRFSLLHLARAEALDQLGRKEHAAQALREAQRGDLSGAVRRFLDEQLQARQSGESARVTPPESRLPDSEDLREEPQPPKRSARAASSDGKSKANPSSASRRDTQYRP